MTTATASAGFQRGEPLAFRANTAAKDAAVCPEGNEASVGGAISRSTAWTVKGRARPTSGFRIRLHKTRSVTRAHPTASPCRRYRFTASSTAASTIQSSPWLQVQLRAGISTSKTPQRRLVWIQSRIPSSSCCMSFSFVEVARRGRMPYYTMTAEPEWYNATFFGCPAGGEKNGSNQNCNRRFAAIVP